jgi:DNA polymerase-3 subunit alpha
LKITDVDPIKYNLYFERFLNPDRVSMPDIDIDFCFERRNEIIEYVKRKYGKDNVAQIITFGSMASKGVLRDVGRVLKIDLKEINKMSKAIPVILGKPLPLEQAIQTIPELKEVAQSQNESHKKLLEYSLILEGLARHASMHAAGVVIAPKEIINYAPLFKQPGTDDITTQYDMKSLEEIGLLKMDFLGLRTLTVINKTIKMLKEKGIEVDLNKIPLDDKKTYQIFENGETVAVFQFESTGMAEYLKKLKPTQIEDLIAMNALYRPGPMEMIDEFIDRKYGRKRVEYLHPKLEPILENTYAIMVYQEQILKIAQEIAGFTLAKADLMRRAMGKKNKEIMAQQREEFINGAVKNDVKKEIAEDIFNLIDKFASYAFNKSHSTAYAIISYQTAYLKAHFPFEFMTANLNSELGDPKRLAVLIDECRRMGIPVLPPDVNESEINFTFSERGIRFGLSAIKNVGAGAVESILKERKRVGRFKNIFELCEKLDLRLVNKKVLESLIQAGALDSLEGHRAQLFNAIDLASSYAQKQQEYEESGQTNIFDLGGSSSQGKTQEKHYPKLPDVPQWSEHDMLIKEKELLGFYVSGHPLLKFEDEVRAFTNVRLDDMEGVRDGFQAKICGMMIEIKTIIDKKGKQMAFGTLENFWGIIEIVIFSDTFDKYREFLKVDSPVMISGKIDRRNEDENPKLICEDVYPLSKVRDIFTKSVGISFDTDKISENLLNKVIELFIKYKGDCGVYVRVRNGYGDVVMRSRRYSAQPSIKLISELRSILGKENVWIKG